MGERKAIRWRAWTGLGVAVGLLVVAAAVVKYGIAPAVIRDRIEKAAARRWSGAVTLGRVNYRYFGPTRIEGVVLTDQQGRRWAQADVVDVLVRGRPALSSQPTHVVAHHVRIDAHLDHGSLTPPLENAPRAAESEHMKDVTIRHLQAAVTDGNRSVMISDGSAVAVRFSPTHYHVLLTEKTRAVWRKLSVGGSVQRASGHCDLHVEADRTFTPEEGAFLIGLLDGPAEWKAGGRLEVNATVSGLAGHPAQLKAEGMARLTNGSVHAGHRAIVSDLRMLLRAADGRIDAEDIACSIYQGRAAGRLFAATDAEGRTALGGVLKVGGVAMQELAVEMGAADKGLQGTASGRLEFTLDDASIEGLRGKGVLLFDKTSLRMFPLNQKILQAMGFDTVDPLQASDVACTFSLSGPCATLAGARFVSAAGAIETQPGGIMNAETGEVDLHVIAAPAGVVGDATRQIPAALGPNEDMLRLHVKGFYWDPPSRLITRTPIGEVSEATMDFIRGAIGGRQTDAVSRPLVPPGAPALQ
ncbi:MAG: hypothetical protein IH624_06290 [Phycisphaerae bacterium]|nr:hypothetical protein [Phycisphaerae bacterium]